MSPSTDPENLTLGPEAIEQMERLGITRVPANYFHVAGYRYTQLKDAVAEAERQRAP